MLERNLQLQQTEQLQRAKENKLQAKRHNGPKGILTLEGHGTPNPPSLKS